MFAGHRSHFPRRLILKSPIRFPDLSCAVSLAGLAQNIRIDWQSDPYALVLSNRATTRGDAANLVGSFGLGSFTTYQRPGTLQPGIVGEKVPPEDFAAWSIVEVQISKGILFPDGKVSSGSAATGIIVWMRVLYHRDVKAKRLHRKCFEEQLLYFSVTQRRWASTLIDAVRSPFLLHTQENRHGD